MSSSGTFKIDIMLTRTLPVLRVSLRGARRVPCLRCRSPQVVVARSFFSLPDISKIANAVKDNLPGEGSDGRQTFHARKILPYSRKQLYALIADVPAYSSFIPFCNSSQIVSQTAHRWDPKSEKPFDVKAELKVGFGGFEESYISRVRGTPYETVTATSEPDMPMFKDLISTWSFAPASSTSPHPTNSALTTPSSSTPVDTSSEDGPTLLTIDLAFTFQNPLHRIASHAVLPTVSDKMVEAFEKRCLEVYGKGDR